MVTIDLLQFVPAQISPIKLIELKMGDVCSTVKGVYVIALLEIL